MNALNKISAVEQARNYILLQTLTPNFIDTKMANKNASMFFTFTKNIFVNLDSVAPYVSNIVSCE